ncbi:hypothetical protein LINGRAHAP2_LOCUS31046 [Linum grandiflorum]
MCIAWDMGIRKLEIQLDSAAAIQILSTRLGDSDQHVYREANVLADYIADLGHTQPLGSLEIGIQGSLLRHWTEHDIIGISQPRAVLV